MLCTEHDKSPNLAVVSHLHPLYVVVACKSKLKVSPNAAQIGARLALEDATQQSRNILAVTLCVRYPDQLSIYREAGQPTLRCMAAIRPTHLPFTSKTFMSI